MLKFMPALQGAGLFLPARWFVGGRPARHAGAHFGRIVLWSGATLAGAAAVLTAVIDAPAPVLHEEARLTWVDIQKPFALYDVNLPGFQQLDRAYEARRHAEGGGRRDRLAFGRIGETPYLRFEVYRLGTEAERQATLHVAAARRAADIGYSLARSGAAAGVETRFGLVEIADVTIERADSRQHCLAFKTAQGKVIRLSGLSCDAGGVAPSRQTLACQIDQIQLMAAGEDQELRDAFVAADRREGANCTPHRLAGIEPATRAAVAAQAQAPKLRGVETVRKGVQQLATTEPSKPTFR